ncbi:MAG: alpha/beta hydrolase [Planctomycetota bacterium]
MKILHIGEEEMKTTAIRAALVLILVACLSASTGPAQELSRAYPPDLPDAVSKIYKTVGDVELKVWIFFPDGHRPSDRRAAIVFFFGGGWRQGTPNQFAPQSRYLASRGMVAMVADYRVADRHGVKVAQCVEDAKSAVRWLRANARDLGVDPDRIAAGGGSAGGHLAAATATVPGFDAAGEDVSVSAVPNAVVLFNPALGDASPPPADRIASLTARAGVDPMKITPSHHVGAGVPPTIIFHGEADERVPYETAVAFCNEMKRMGNSCRVVGYEGAQHGFFNYGRGDGEAYRDTLRRAVEFLTSLEYLEGEPTIGAAD